MDLVKTNTEALAVLLALTDTGGILDGATVRLFTNDVQPVVTSDVADFTPASYIGFGDKVVTWLAPSISDDGTPEVIGTVPEFRPTNDVNPNTVFGALLLDPGDILMEGGRFEGGPLPMESAMDSILITVRLRFDQVSIAVVVS